MVNNTAVVLMLAVLALGTAAAQASAGVEQFMSDGQGLSAGNAKSSSTGHTGIDVVFSDGRGPCYGTSDIWFRGAVWNPNQVTFDVFDFARYQW